MIYKLRLSFRDKPECDKCMLSTFKPSITCEVELICTALANRPICKEQGCRKDCPLDLDEQ